MLSYTISSNYLVVQPKLADSIFILNKLQRVNDG